MQYVNKTTLRIINYYKLENPKWKNEMLMFILIPPLESHHIIDTKYMKSREINKVRLEKC